jgi:hypothetical protein
MGIYTSNFPLVPQNKHEFALALHAGDLDSAFEEIAKLLRQRVRDNDSLVLNFSGLEMRRNLAAIYDAKEAEQTAQIKKARAQAYLHQFLDIAYLHAQDATVALLGNVLVSDQAFTHLNEIYAYRNDVREKYALRQREQSYHAAYSDVKSESAIGYRAIEVVGIELEKISNALHGVDKGDLQRAGLNAVKQASVAP